MKSLRLASLSMCSGIDRSANLATAYALVREAAELGADWVQLPEVFSFIGDPSQAWQMAEPATGPLQETLRGWAREFGIVLFAGTVGERPPADSAEASAKRVYNTLYVYGRQGELCGQYRKVHLFSLFDAAGTATHDEAQTFAAGDELVCVDIDGYRVGLSICYDLRFADFYSALSAAAPLDVLVCPAAFTMRTGKDHWELLLRARAVENLCYVYAANQCGQNLPGKESYGHALIIDPWGHKLADTGDSPGIALATLDSARLQQVRRQLPVLQHRRPDVYRQSME